ncbi:DUF2058 family protein, partial [Pyxidicoccus sp. 3LG]
RATAGPPRGSPPRSYRTKSIPKLPPMPGSKAYQRAESKKQVELDRALRELVLGSQIPIEAGETTFYFMTRKGKLRRLELSPAQAKQLEEGELGVVERPEPAQIEHSLVPAAAAEQMYALSKKAVRFFNRKDNPVGFMNEEDLKAQQAAEADRHRAGAARRAEAARRGRGRVRGGGCSGGRSRAGSGSRRAEARGRQHLIQGAAGPRLGACPRGTGTGEGAARNEHSFQRRPAPRMGRAAPACPLPCHIGEGGVLAPARRGTCPPHRARSQGAPRGGLMALSSPVTAPAQPPSRPGVSIGQP